MFKLYSPRDKKEAKSVFPICKHNKGQTKGSLIRKQFQLKLIETKQDLGFPTTHALAKRVEFACA